MIALIRRYPLVTFFTLTFAISWGGFLLLSAGTPGFRATPAEVERLLPIFVLCVLAGPSLASVLSIILLDGRAGFRSLALHLARWRVPGRWYGMAILTAPVIMIALLLLLSLFSGRFVPTLFAADDQATVLIAGLATALGAGIFEELGWTGFAIPQLRGRLGVLATGLIVGVVWAAWHVLPALWLSGTVSGTLSLTSYMLDPFLFLVGFRVLMVWVYDHTGSVLLAMLMHGSLTAGARILTPQGIAGVPLLTFDLAWAATIWLIVVAVMAAERDSLPDTLKHS
jgi:membrane protease YdiL (CAAX protease family)